MDLLRDIEKPGDLLPRTSGGRTGTAIQIHLLAGAGLGQVYVVGETSECHRREMEWHSARS